MIKIKNCKHIQKGLFIMPAWSFHIKLATDISNVLKLNKEEENLFILANLIPDIK